MHKCFDIKLITMSTHYNGTPDERQALDLYIKLTRASDVVNQRINSHLKAWNLSVSQFGVLEALYHLGPLTAGSLADKILKSSGNLTLVLENLVKRGLVERQRDPADRRRVVVHLTDLGRDQIDAILPIHVTRVVDVMGALSAEEQAQLAALARKLGLGQSDIELP